MSGDRATGTVFEPSDCRFASASECGGVLTQDSPPPGRYEIALARRALRMIQSGWLKVATIVTLFSGKCAEFESLWSFCLRVRFHYDIIKITK